MLNGWIFTDEQIKDSPSIRKGMTVKEEERARRDGCRIIMDVGAGLRLKANPTMATAGLYFHRFYMCHAFQEFPYQFTALGCLFLAGKVEETPKKCRDVCRLAAEKNPNCQYYADPRTLQDEVMGIERVLLQTLKFDLQVDHPYKYLIEYVKSHNLPREAANGYIQAAWTFVNDSIHTTLCLQWEPQIIAVAMLHLSFTMSKKRGEDTYTPVGEWWERYVLNMTPTLLESICHSVLDFYTVSRVEMESPKTTNSEPSA